MSDTAERTEKRSKPTIIDSDPCYTQKELDDLVDWVMGQAESSELYRRTLGLVKLAMQNQYQAFGKLTTVSTFDVDWLIDHAEPRNLWRAAWSLRGTIRRNEWPLPMDSQVKPDTVTWAQLADYLGIGEHSLKWKARKGEIDTSELMVDYEADLESRLV